MIRVHFIGFEPARSVIPLAFASGVGARSLDSFESNRYAELARTASSLFAPVSIAEAQVAVYPHEYTNGPVTYELSRQAQAAGLPIVFFRQSDNEEPALVPYGTVYRDSMNASQRTPCEMAMPAFADDPLVGRELKLLDKPPVPRVAFCGYVGSSTRVAFYVAMGRLRKVKGLALRRQALSALMDTPGLATDIIERRQYWGGAINLWGRRVNMLKNRLLPGKSRATGATRDEKTAHRVYEEYIANLLGSPYNLCIRGAGNFSYRFYETLAAGRIPVFVDTDCVLPFQEEIDYRRHCVWLDLREMRQIGKIVQRFHERVGDDEFRAIQRENRELWQKRFTPVAFYQRVLEQAIERRARRTDEHDTASQDAPSGGPIANERALASP